MSLGVAAFGQDHPIPPPHYTPWNPAKVASPDATTTGSSVAPELFYSTWTAIGPASLNEFGERNSGRIAGLAADPTIANTLYLAAAGGGVWKSTDGGTTWAALTDTQQTLAMGAIAVAPSNGSILYAGTGEANNSADSQYGRGILTSTTSGGGWTLNTGPAGIFSTNFLTTSKIAVHPTDPMTAYAAMGNVGDNAAFHTGTGIYKTTNGGVDWANVTLANGKDNANSWSDVVIDPNTPATVYAAIGTFYSNATTGVYKSIDSGATWNLLTAFPHGSGTPGRISIAISKANSQVVYVSVENVSTGGVLAVDRSDNGGTSITNVTPANYMGGQGWYDQAVIVDPANAAHVFVTGAAGAGSMLFSFNSGATWTAMSGGTGAVPHADHHALTFDASGNLIDGDDGGIFRLATASLPTVTWTDLNANINTIQFQGIAIHPTDSTIACGGSQDNGTEKMIGGNPVWVVTDGGDGGLVRFSQQNPTHVYRDSPVASFGPANFFRISTNTCNTWTSATTGLNGAIDNANFYPPFTVDPTNGDHALFGSDHIYETTNFAGNWTALNRTGFSGNPIDAIAIAPSDPNNTFYTANGGFFAASSQILVTTNHAGTWTAGNLPSGNGRVANIIVDTHTASTAYAVVSTFNANGHVFKTINTGTTWTAIGTVGAGLPDLPTWTIRQDPRNAKTLWVGNDIGVYQTTNGGTTWSRYGAGLPNVQVLDLDLNKMGILGAGTHGRGMWEIVVVPPCVPSCALD